MIFNESLMPYLSDKSVGTSSALFTNNENSGSNTNSLIKKYMINENLDLEKTPKKRVVHIAMELFKKPDEELDMPPLENVLNDDKAISLVQQEDEVTSTPIEGTNI